MHVPVLLKETIEYLAPAPGEIFVDGTLGDGGHALEIARKIGSSGWLIGIDQDAAAIKAAKESLANVPCKQSLVLGNFRKLPEILDDLGAEKVNGVLLDIGFSSNQLKGRGLSFLSAEKLDMRLASEETAGDLNALEIINDWEEEHLADIIYGYGEEKFSRRIAAAIVEARAKGPIETTDQLVEIIRQAVPEWYTKKRIHFATKTFQGLRIAVNDELGALREGLEGAWRVLEAGGRIGVISFHSLEARIVKDFFQAKKRQGEGKTGKAIKAGREEILNNPRARSAQLRVIQKNS